MEFKRCERCGCFFASNNNVCCNCQPKDTFEMSQLKSYFEETDSLGGDITATIDAVSYQTGISIKNLNRYLTHQEFLQDNKKITKTEINLK